MSELIIALVVLVLGATAVVVRLLIGELRKPAKSTAKSTGKTAAGAAATGTRPTAAATRMVTPAAAATAASGAGAMAHGAGAAPGGTAVGSTATLTREQGTGGDAPARTGVGTTAPPATEGGARRARRARMRDVVERGDGVRISAWRRLRAFVSLVVLVTVLGLGAAGVVGAIALLVAYTLDQAVS